MGRPREFEVDVALAAALELFWRHGFEGTSLSDLTRAMGITRPSLYATFGNKEELFRKALDRYLGTFLCFLVDALAEPDIQRGMERLLTGCVDTQTAADHPPGCLMTNGALVCSDDASGVRRQIQEHRQEKERAIAARIEQAKQEGQLPPDCDAAACTTFITTVMTGISVQAAFGMKREALQAVARKAARCWSA
ncbi:TetR/AcrR family transcriptional regulator [Rhizosaccharibacter radicis]|uniref:TetR/AcrR family transcriptional regulator n=1 Tax=Rhizosaccharibacter radicis TaxID=2782605 RepID=A0ABT1VYK9_9PROT|nr:TetR/AcrR family transcriptional regulator [Acetobacteraceae bacterium KSS12]